MDKTGVLYNDNVFFEDILEVHHFNKVLKNTILKH